MSTDATRNLKLIRANQALENMYLLPTSNREATFQDDDGNRVPIVVDYRVWPPSILLNYYVSRVYSQEIFSQWIKRVAEISEPIDRALILIDVVDEFNDKNNKFTEGWNNERDDRDYR